MRNEDEREAPAVAIHAFKFTVRGYLINAFALCSLAATIQCQLAG